MLKDFQLFPISFRKRTQPLLRKPCFFFVAVALQPHLLQSSAHTHALCCSGGEILVAPSAPRGFPPPAVACAFSLSLSRTPTWAFFTWLILTHSLRLLLQLLPWHCFPEPEAQRNITFLCVCKPHSVQLFFFCLTHPLAIYLMTSTLIQYIS